MIALSACGELGVASRLAAVHALPGTMEFDCRLSCPSELIAVTVIVYVTPFCRPANTALVAVGARF